MNALTHTHTHTHTQAHRCAHTYMYTHTNYHHPTHTKVTPTLVTLFLFYRHVLPNQEASTQLAR